jgi:hypothetical protein
MKLIYDDTQRKEEMDRLIGEMEKIKQDYIEKIAPYIERLTDLRAYCSIRVEMTREEYNDLMKYAQVKVVE